MAELRYNPLLKDWTIVASHRQKRPNMPKDFCPFCPGSGKVPDHYDVHLYPNDFPALRPDPPEADDVGGGPYKTKQAYGNCDVVLYSPDHHGRLTDLSADHMRKLVDLWNDTYVQRAQEAHNEYVMIFENRGEEVGVTMPHPHGQIYAYSFIPLKVQTELDACREHYEENGSNLFDDMIAEEKRFGERVIMENDHFIAYIPFFNDYPFGVYVVAKEAKTALPDFNDAAKDALGNMLQDIVGAMDTLYDRLFPYMMVMHQRPTNGMDVDDYYRFHIEFYPPLRAADRIKFNASSETGGWAATNPRAVEETAVELRDALARYRETKGES